MTDATERAIELLVDKATQGLNPSQEHELEELLPRCQDLDPESFELAAAAVELAVTSPGEPMPTALRDRLSSQAKDYFSEDSESPQAEPQTSGHGEVVPFPANRETRSLNKVAGWTGWLIAATLLVGILGWWPRPQPILTPSQARDVLSAEASDLLRLDWASTSGTAPSELGGEIVWSTAAQRGFMTFRGLPVNDPSIEQYQLWIFDKEQDERFPIDGGVFDITSQGEVVVEIRANIGVTDPTLFAITIEKPGGVVVSSRERLPLLAQVS